jgi:hypothetical protein
MKSNKIALLAAAASMTFAGAAFAQSAPATTQPVPPATSTTTTTTQPVAPTTMEPAAPATSSTTTTTTTAPAAEPSADTAATPTSAAIAPDFKIGSQVKDPAGVVVGSISGTSAAADGSTNVVITSGAVKFALPGASLAMATDGYSTTATKAQIDATLAGAKPH